MISDPRRRLQMNTLLIFFNKQPTLVVFSARDTQSGKGFSLLKFYIETA
jgi:hypothetical protein